MKRDGVLPAGQKFSNKSRLCSLDFNKDEILNLVIRTLNIQKSHNHEEISIRMIQICNKSLLKLLIILFEETVICYPNIGKRSNIVISHKMNEKKLVKNCQTIYILLTLVKHLEK